MLFCNVQLFATILSRHVKIVFTNEALKYDVYIFDNIQIYTAMRGSG